MQDTFYPRLDFYRMLHAGMTSLPEMALALGVSVRTLQRWKQHYDPKRGPYGSLQDISVRDRLGFPHQPPEESGGQTGLAAINVAAIRQGSREEILWSLRRAALDGNVPAARVVLEEYSRSGSASFEPGEVLDIEKAIELLRQWHGKDDQSAVVRGLAPACR